MSSVETGRFVIRNAQLEAIEQGTERELHREIVSHLRLTNTEGVKKIDDRELERRVRIGVKRARERGMISAGVLTLYCSLLIDISPGFDSYEPIAKLLAETERSADENMLLLSERITAEQWVEAKKMADPGYWETV